MFGTILMSIGTFFEEVSDSIGKAKVANKEESLYTMASLNLFWSVILFSLIGLLKSDTFIFNLASWPTFTIRIVLEIIQMYVTVLAISKADRSTFGFLRTATIPLLLLVDFILGYRLGFLPITGMVIILISLWAVFLSKGFKKAGTGIALFTSVNAVATISLFKYNITHFNSVVAEQLIIKVLLLIIFFSLAMIRAKENPIKLSFKTPAFFFQSFLTGLSGVLESFSYNYGTASVIITAKRSSAVLWSLFSGKTYFREQGFLLKLLLGFLLIAGLILLAFNF